MTFTTAPREGNGSTALQAQAAGLTAEQAKRLLAQFGPNTLPEPSSPSFVFLFLRQFLSPLIYILLAAVIVSLSLGDMKDALFIGAVLLINGFIGAGQEYSAGQAAAALRKLEQPHAFVIRDGKQQEIDARDLVPGDLVLLEAGAKVPADMQLIEAADLQCDESLLTGESEPVKKRAAGREEDAALERRAARAIAGSMVTRGRGRGIVTATGAATEIGKIAEEIGKRSISQPPLLIRLERFSRMIAAAVGAAVLLLVVVGLLRQMPFHELFMMAVGLAVSAVPEGLPVSISVALAIAMRRMAKVHVLIRKLPAVESLGSCTMIATDKTGTLTMNELTVTDILLPDGTALICESGQELEACTIRGVQHAGDEAKARAAALLRAAALPNEALLIKEEEGWKGRGDMVDVALLAAVRKGGIRHEELRERYPLAARIPYEPDLKYAASFHQAGEKALVFVKGAPEKLIAMSERMDAGGEAVPIDRGLLLRQQEELSQKGLRVLGFAEREIAPEPDRKYGHGHLVDLTFLGLAGMQDPVRPEVPHAISECHSAGIEVVMVTGDNPKTASAIAANAGLAFLPSQVVTGEDVRRAEEKGHTALDRLTRDARIYARVEPTQKLSIVLSLARNGHFVAVTGDGVNDAPALKHAHVGVAMGRMGTDLAKESADIIITDDNFASIVEGIRQGRVAYANIRKVIFLLVSTGAAEVALFLLAIPLGMPMPLLPVQLLWLNLVTNGIQHVALAAEKPEGDELSYPPRKPKEPIFDNLMMKRILYSMLVMGAGGFATFYLLLGNGYGDAQARNLLLLLFVLFENFQALNSRSEHHSLFRAGFFTNPLLICSVIGAQFVHLAASYVPGLNETLGIAPVTSREWLYLLVIASVLLAVIEFAKWQDRRRERRVAPAVPPRAAPEFYPSREVPAAAGAQAPEIPHPAIREAGWLWPAVAAAVALLVLGAGSYYWTKVREAAPRYVTEKAGRGAVTRTVRGEGIVSPRPGMRAEALVSGKIGSVRCAPGAKVRAGEICATIEEAPFLAAAERAKAALAAAENDLAASQARLDRAKAAIEQNEALAKRKAVSRAQAEKARSAFQRAQSQLKRSEAEAARRKKALEAAEDSLARTKIMAPADGIVLSRNAEAGQAVTAGSETPLFVIAPETAAVEAYFDMRAKEAAGIKAGDPVTITAHSLPGREFSGKVSEIREMARPGEAGPGRLIIISVADPGLALVPGMKVEAVIVTGQREDVLRIPSQALLYSGKRSDPGMVQAPPPGGAAELWILREGKPYAVKVELGLGDGAYTEIVSGELQPGDLLILDE